METKICNRCGKEKPITEFCYRKKENEYRNPCKECRKKYLDDYAKRNDTKLQEYRKEYYALNKEHKLQYQSKYRKENEEKIIEQRKKYNPSVYQKTKEYKQRYYSENKEELNKKSRAYWETHTEAIREQQKRYFNENKEILYYKRNKRKQTDKLFKLKCQVRNMLWESFNRKSKWKRIKGQEILGCEIDSFIQYLLKTYRDIYGEEWDGIEKVHIDHIIPLSTANTEEEIIGLCHYTNLQLLKEKDNLKKSDKSDWKIKK